MPRKWHPVYNTYIYLACSGYSCRLVEKKENQPSTLPVPEVVCYPGPSHIAKQRKSKRRCLGIHPYPVMFDRHVEVLPDVSYELTATLLSCQSDSFSQAVETVWGGGGSDSCRVPGQTTFHFKPLHKQSNISSSVTSGQIPVIYFAWNMPTVSVMSYWYAFLLFLKEIKRPTTTIAR